MYHVVKKKLKIYNENCGVVPTEYFLLLLYTTSLKINKLGKMIYFSPGRAPTIVNFFSYFYTTLLYIQLNQLEYTQVSIAIQVMFVGS